MPGTRDRGPDFSSGVLDADARLRLNDLRRTFERDIRERRMEHEANERNVAQQPSGDASPHSTDRGSATPGCDGQPAVRPT